MSFAALPVVICLLMASLAGAALPWLALFEHRQALAKRRSLYDKGAIQLAGLAAALLAATALALGADWAAGGAIRRSVAPPLHPLLLVAIAGAAASAIFSFAGSRAFRASRFGRGCALLAIAGLCALPALAAGLPLAWLALRGFTPEPDLALTVPALIRLVFFVGLGWRLFAAFIALCLFWAPACGQALALGWHVLRRRADDFGRDYYQFAVGRRSRLAAYAGALALIPAAFLPWLAPAFSVRRVAELMLSPDLAFWALPAASLGLPLAVLCCWLVARSPAPLRKKALIFASPLLLAIGMWGSLARLCL